MTSRLRLGPRTRVVAVAVLLLIPAGAGPLRAEEAGCAPPEATRSYTAASDERGMGGTGARRDPGELSGEDRGMGGTGIFGTVTGFGSLCVNGLRVVYDGRTPVTQSGRDVDARELRAGQSVWVEASGGVASLRAERISLAPALSGPVTELADGRISVMNQRIELEAGLQGEPDLLAPGRFVTVHGLRDARGVVRATRIERARPGSPASLTGRVTTTPGGEWGVGSTRVRAPGVPTAGSFVQVRGDWDAKRGRLVASRVAPLLAAPAFERFSVETFVGALQAEDRVDTSVLPIDLSRLPALAVAGLVEGVRVWASGPLDEDGFLVAESFALEPEGGGEPFPVLDLADELDEEDAEDAGRDDDDRDDQEADDDLDEDGLDDGLDDDLDEVDDDLDDAEIDDLDDDDLDGDLDDVPDDDDAADLDDDLDIDDDD